MPQANPIQLAFQAFQQAGAIEAMGQAVAQYPVMTEADFIAAIGQVIAMKVPPEHRSAFEQRLAWLRRIAKGQNE